MPTLGDTRTLRAIGTVHEVLDQLQAATTRDDQAEKALRGLNTWRSGLIGLLVVSSIPGIMLAAGTDGLALVVVIPVWIALIAAIIAISVRVSREAKSDFDDEKLALVSSFLSVMAQDVPRKAKCSVMINSDGYRKHGQLVEKTGGALFSPDRSMRYVDPWGLVCGEVSTTARHLRSRSSRT